MWVHFRKERERKARIQARLSGSRPVPVGMSRFVVPTALAFLMWLAVIFLLNLADGLSHAPLSEGQRAPGTVIAQVDFEVVDLAATELARRQAADAVLPIFVINQSALQSALRSADHLFDRLVEVRSVSASPRTTLPEQMEVSGSLMPVEEALLLAPAGEEDTVRMALRKALTGVWSQGIISSSEKESLFHGVAASGLLSIGLQDQSLRTPVEIAKLYSPDEATRATVTRIHHELDGITIPQRLLYGFVRILIQPNIMYDGTRTDTVRQHAQRSARIVHKPVRAGSTIINQGDRITAQQVEEWRAHERRLNELQSPQDRRLRWIGRSVLLLFALVICSGLLQIVRPDIVQSPSRILLLVILSLLTLVSVSGLLFLSNTTALLPAAFVEFMLPLAFAPILVTILIGPATAVVIGVWTSFTAAVMFDNSFSIFAMGLLVTIIVAHTARNLRARSRMARIGLLIGLAQTLYCLSLAVLNQLPAPLVASQVGIALVNGLVTALLATVFLPLFESLFDITTDITLLEMSDMGHPLLQRLAIEAPGTYHHSLMVAHLAQAAAAEIGANALLVRVCAYFHDIGKLTKPEFFVENTQFRENPHDDLTPSMSTLVIISHVKEGVGMARRAKLPKPLIEAIEQHHGTSLVAYFYHRAKTQKGGGEGTGPSSVPRRDVDDHDFRYPGPKPQTREMGILLLADSVEAASRSMEKPTPSRIENLVHDIVDSRLQDEQLDDCDLTFAQLKAIKRTFIFTLTNMLHGRVPYPKDENNHPQSTEKSAALGDRTEAVRAVGHGASPDAR